MPPTPVIFKTNHRAKFDDLDLNGHMNTNRYGSYFMENRFEGHREHFGLDIKHIMQLPFAIYTKKFSIEFYRPILADSEFTIVSHVSEYKGETAIVEAEMLNHKEVRTASCTMILVCIDKSTMKPSDWPDTFINRFFSEKSDALGARTLKPSMPLACSGESRLYQPPLTYRQIAWVGK